MMNIDMGQYTSTLDANYKVQRLIRQQLEDLITYDRVAALEYFKALNPQMQQQVIEGHKNDNVGITLIHCAVSYNNRDNNNEVVIRALVDYNVNINAVETHTNQWNTYRFAENDNTRDLLLELGGEVPEDTNLGVISNYY